MTLSAIEKEWMEEQKEAHEKWMDEKEQKEAHSYNNLLTN